MWKFFEVFIEFVTILLLYMCVCVCVCVYVYQVQEGREELPHAPKPEARGGGQEEQPHVQGAVAARAQEGLEELSHIEGQEGRR